MKSTIFATAALVAASTVNATGSAVVLNKCNYDVYLYNVPSSNGGYSTIDKVLSTDGTYTQQYTELSNGNGWSIKLSNSTNLGSILQYEYTFHDDGIIWYDLSAVDGNPWDSNWEITADKATCVPRQAAYRYATDDAYGMQSCADDTTITVTLCSGESQNDEGAASVSSSVAANTGSATASSKAASTSASATATSTQTSATATSAPVVTTTLQTSVIASTLSTTTTTWSHHWGNGKRETHPHAARHPHARN